MADTALTFEVQVIDRGVISVPVVEAAGRFSSEVALTTRSGAVTDHDGCARLSDRHPESPGTVGPHVGDDPCETHEVTAGRHIVPEM